MTYSQTMSRLNEKRMAMYKLREEMRSLQAEIEPQPVEDHTLQNLNGAIHLSELFGDKKDLIVIHNMGRTCAYCTLWADGYNGVYEHLANRAAFVVVSPDSPADQQAFAKGRGWRFPMASHAGSTFATDMGFGSAKDGWMPGCSVFQKRGEGVVRVSDTHMGPGDVFCSVFHFFDMLPEGTDGWGPKFKYPAETARSRTAA